MATANYTSGIFSVIRRFAGGTSPGFFKLVKLYGKPCCRDTYDLGAAAVVFNVSVFCSVQIVGCYSIRFLYEDADRHRFLFVFNVWAGARTDSADHKSFRPYLHVDIGYPADRGADG